MTTRTAPAASTGLLVPGRRTGTLRRIGALGRAEALLLRRNAIALVTALALPASLVPVLRSADEAGGAPGLDLGAAVVIMLAAVALLFAVYYNLVTTLVARREDLVLKRLRTGEAE
nr:hypothetical protein [Micromonospora sp. DSM 115978]